MKAYTLTEVLEDEKNHPAGTFYKWAEGDQSVHMVVAGSADDYSRVLIEYDGPEKFAQSFVYTMHDIGRDDLNRIKFIKFKKAEYTELDKSEGNYTFANWPNGRVLLASEGESQIPAEVLKEFIELGTRDEYVAPFIMNQLRESGRKDVVMVLATKGQIAAWEQDILGAQPAPKTSDPKRAKAIRERIVEISKAIRDIEHKLQEHLIWARQLEYAKMLANNETALHEERGELEAELEKLEKVDDEKTALEREILAVEERLHELHEARDDIRSTPLTARLKGLEATALDNKRKELITKYNCLINP